MERPTFKHRFINPVLSVFIVTAISFIGYFGSQHLENNALHQIIAKISGTTYFLSVAFSTLYIFTIGYIRNASMTERILASFIVPSIWMTKEVMRLSFSHPALESIYWYLNPLNIWLTSFIVLEMGIGTMIGRLILSHRGKDIKVITIAPITVILGSLGFAISVYAWGQGENIYVMFLEGYRLLFGSGV